MAEIKKNIKNIVKRFSEDEISNSINEHISRMIQCPKNKKAIFFAISEDYCFAVANVIMSLYSSSREMIKDCDIIIFHDGISDDNMNLLKELHADTKFIPISFPEIFDNILSHKQTLRWGIYVICKMYIFDLVKYYDKVLHLDADMFIKGNIEDIFRVKEMVAWRKVIAWEPNKIFAAVKNNDERSISAGNGGVLCFSGAVRKYNITASDIKNAFEIIKNLKNGGIDELILAWLVYEKDMSVKELEVGFNAPASRYTPNNEEIKIIHFLSTNGVLTKPWKSLAAYLYFDEWVANYQRWITMGGDGPIKYTKEDYYNLFEFEKAGLIKKLKGLVNKF